MTVINHLMLTLIKFMHTCFSVDVVVVEIQVPFGMRQRGLQVLVHVDQPVFVFVSSNEEGADFFLLEVGEDRSDFLRVHEPILIGVE